MAQKQLLTLDQSSFMQESDVLQNFTGSPDACQSQKQPFESPNQAGRSVSMDKSNSPLPAKHRKLRKTQQDDEGIQ
jgi:hypothetical protein